MSRGQAPEQEEKIIPPLSIQLLPELQLCGLIERKKPSKLWNICMVAVLLLCLDYLQTNVDREMMDKLITGYKKGNFIQHKMSELTKKYETSDESLRKAIVLK